jgi:thiol-disulfide isomerase/thioredoxin
MNTIRLFFLLALSTGLAYPQDWVMNRIPDSAQTGAALPSDFLQNIEREVGKSFGSQVPQLHFQDVYAGKRDSLTSLRGKVVMVIIWNVGCRPCVVEMPILIELQSQLSGRGFVLVTVAMDDTARQRKFFLTKELVHGGIAASVRPEDYKYPFQYLLNPAGYIVDRGGILRDFWAGPKTHDEILKRILEYL